MKSDFTWLWDHTAARTRVEENGVVQGHEGC